MSATSPLRKYDTLPFATAVKMSHAKSGVHFHRRRFIICDAQTGVCHTP